MTERSPVRSLEAETAWARAWIAAMFVASLGALVAVTLDLPPPLRPALTIGFVVACPGMALVRLTRLGGPLTETMLAVALSLSLAGIVAGVLLYLGAWSPGASLMVLVAITWTALALDPALGLRRRRVDVRAAIARGAVAAASASGPAGERPTGTPGSRSGGDRPTTASPPVPPARLTPAGGAEPPPPPLAVVRRRAPAPTTARKSRGRGRAVLGDDPFDEGQPDRALRNTIEQVVDDLAELRNGKRS